MLITDVPLFQIDFLNIASISMLKQPDFYDRNDESRIHMIKAVKNLRSWDPEFVLKVRKVESAYSHPFAIITIRSANFMCSYIE